MDGSLDSSSCFYFFLLLHSLLNGLIFFLLWNIQNTSPINYNSNLMGIVVIPKDYFAKRESKKKKKSRATFRNTKLFENWERIPLKTITWSWKMSNNFIKRKSEKKRIIIYKFHPHKRRAVFLSLTSTVLHYQFVVVESWKQCVCVCAT